MLSKFTQNYYKFCHKFQHSRHLSQHTTVLSVDKCYKYSDPKALTFKYPRYESPFTISINANYSKWMDRYCTQWAIDNSGAMKGYDKYRMAIEKSDNGFFAATTYPSANWHRCEKLMKWSLIFFLCDDYHDISVVDGRGHAFKCQPFWVQLTEVLDSFLAPEYFCNNEWPDFVRAVQQILREIYFDYSSTQIKRSVDMIKSYVLGNLDECEWTGSAMNWENYLHARLGSVGGQMCLQMVEYAKDIELTDSEWNHPLIQSLNSIVTEELILINDYYTFRKEVVENNENFYQMKHPFALLVNNDGLSLQSAVNRVHDMIVQKDNDIIAQFVAIDTCLDLGSMSVAKYVEGVKEVLGGYWRHAISARRYHGLNFVDSVIPIEGHFIYDSKQTVIKNSNNRGFNFAWNKKIPDNVQG